jgi:Ca2+-dependent lipid-binding protein
MLTIKICDARKIRALIKGKYSDPFCVINYGDESAKTSVKPKTLAPDWNEEFEFEADIEDDPMLKLTMFNKDKYNNKFLGQVEISLVSLADGNATSVEWYDLLNKEGVREAKSRGEIQIEMSFEKSEHMSAAEAKSGGGLSQLSETVVHIKNNDVDIDEPDVPTWLRGYQALGQWRDRIHGKQD